MYIGVRHKNLCALYIGVRHKKSCGHCILMSGVEVVLIGYWCVWCLLNIGTAHCIFDVC
jgi:hypothetical protein